MIMTKVQVLVLSKILVKIEIKIFLVLDFFIFKYNDNPKKLTSMIFCIQHFIENYILKINQNNKIFY